MIQNSISKISHYHIQHKYYWDYTSILDKLLNFTCSKLILGFDILILKNHRNTIESILNKKKERKKTHGSRNKVI